MTRTNMDRIVEIDNWSIIVNMQPGGDCLVVCGQFYNHPKFMNGHNGIPGAFKFFDRENRVATSISGTRYSFGKFVGNGNAKTESEAFDWIEAHWVKP